MTILAFFLACPPRMFSLVTKINLAGSGIDVAYPLTTSSWTPSFLSDAVLGLAPQIEQLNSERKGLVPRSPTAGTTQPKVHTQHSTTSTLLDENPSRSS